MNILEANEINRWMEVMHSSWGGSAESISCAMELPVEQVIATIGSQNLRSNGREQLQKALLHDNDELAMFWQLYRESWRDTESPLCTAHAYSHLQRMLRPNSSVTFEACIEMRELFDSAFASVKTCWHCNRLMINIPFLQTQAPECCQ